MVAVTVVARGNIRSDIGLTQLHRLSVVGVMVALQALLVTSPTALVTDLFEVRRGVVRLDLVGRMAVRANRAARITSQEQLSMNALVVDLFHP